MMSKSEPQEVLEKIASNFDALTELTQDAIDFFAEDEATYANLAALQRAKDAASRGANVARSARAE